MFNIVLEQTSGFSKCNHTRIVEKTASLFHVDWSVIAHLILYCVSFIVKIGYTSASVVFGCSLVRLVQTAKQQAIIIIN